MRQVFEAVGGAHYIVFFWMAGNPSEVPSASCYYDSVNTMSVDANNGGSPLSFSFNTSGKGYRSMGWVGDQYDFDAAAAGTTTVTFTSTSPAGNRGPAIDAVTIYEMLPTAAQCN